MNPVHVANTAAVNVVTNYKLAWSNFEWRNCYEMSFVNDLNGEKVEIAVITIIIKPL